jgi:hypothetical protein
MIRHVLLVALVLVACVSACDDNGGTTPPPDSTVPDTPVGGETSPPPDGPTPKVDGVVPDLPQGPDGPPPAPEWKTVPGAGPAVASPTATLLNDGRVLVVGGYVYKSPTSTVPVYQKAAWLYDPSQNAFVSAGEMSVERCYHTASLLPDGRVLVVGGYDGSNEHGTTEIFDPTKPAASAWSAGPSLTDARSSHSAVTLSDGRVVIAGGAAWPNFLSGFEIYKPSTNSFQLPAAGMIKGRRSMGTALLSNGKVLLAGGDDGSSAFADVMETYDPNTGTVATLGVTLTNKKSAPFAFTLPSGKVMITAGYAFAYPPSDDLFDPNTATTMTLTHPGGSARGSAATLLKDGRVLVAGGYESAQQSKVRVFNEQGVVWDTEPDMLNARSYFALVTLKDGSVLAIGGREGSKYTFPAEAERLYNP